MSRIFCCAVYSLFLGCGSPSGAFIDLDAAAAEDASPPDFGAAPLPTWSRRVGGYSVDRYNYDSPVGVYQTADRGFTIATSIGWIQHYSGDGDLVWDSQISASIDGFALVDDRHIIVSTGTNDENFRRVEVSRDGTSATQILYTSSEPQRVVQEFRVLPDGASVVAGSVGQGERKAWLLGLSTEGTVVWEQTIDNTDVAMRGMAAVGNGRVGVTGFAPGGAWIAELNRSSLVAWSITLDLGLYTVGTAMVATSDGGWLVAGQVNLDGPNGLDIWLSKVAADGTVLWQKTIGTTAAETPSMMIATASGGFLITGSRDVDGRPAVWAIAFHESGDVEWQNTYSSEQEIFGLSVTQADDGGYALAATIRYKDILSPSDVLVFHVDSKGKLEDIDCSIRVSDLGAVATPANALATASPITINDTVTHSAQESSLITTSRQEPLYSVALCGLGESTTWDSTSDFGQSCTCTPASLCVGPAVGCAIGLTCLGRYDNGGDQVAECTYRCGSITNCPGACTLFNVSGTNLGLWCE